jgi:hypothetical protein
VKKGAFFACFASMRNVEIWSETKIERSETKQKRSKKLPLFSLRSEMKRNGSEILPSFSLRSEIKRNGSEKLPSFSLWSEMKQNGCEIFFALMRILLVFGSETKMKWTENKTKKKQNKNFLEAKQS